MTSNQFAHQSFQTQNYTLASQRGVSTDVLSYHKSPARRIQNTSFLDNKRPFDAFTRQVSPTPPPTQWGFYWENLKDGLWDSYSKGSTRYFQGMAKHPIKSTLGVLATAGFGTLMTIFYRNSRLLESMFLLGLLAYPITKTVSLLPKMEDAYQTVLNGDPAKGKRQFKKSLDEYIYQVAHVFLKPLTYAITFATIFAIPQRIRWIKNGESFLGFLQPVFNALKVNDQWGFLKHLDKANNALMGIGDSITKRVLFWKK